MRPGRSQELSLQEVLAGKTVPLTLTFKDLTPEWRRFSLGGQSDMSSFMRLAMGIGANSDVYYSKGQTFTVGNETYAIAYRPKIKGTDLLAMMRGNPANVPVPQEKITPDTQLILALLNQRTMGSLMDIRPFDMAQEIAAANAEGGGAGGPGGQRPAALNAQSMSNMKQLGLGMMMYAQDHNETLPPMQDAASWKKAIMPYIKNEDVFVHPGTKAAYVPNPLMNGRHLADIAEPANTIAATEAAPSADGTLAVLYMDGHVKRLSPDQVTALKPQLARILGAAPAAPAHAEPEVTVDKAK